MGRARSVVPARRGARAVVVVEVVRIAGSCDYAVPLYDCAGERDLLDQWAGRKDEAAMAADRAQRNSRSIDGLPALPVAATDRQAGSGMRGGLSACLNAAGMLPGDHPEALTGLTSMREGRSPA